MKNLVASFVVFASLFVVVVACGRLNDKFGRKKSDYTRVQFRSEGGDLSPLLQSGGVMIYFSRNGSGSDRGGVAFGFANENGAISTPVAVPNGSYKVYAISYAGSPLAEGQVRCAFGNNGGDVNLTGQSVSVSLTLNTSNCAFNSDGPFSHAYGADADSSTNFDKITVSLCADEAFNCNPATASTYSFRVRLVGGEKPAGAGTSIIVSPSVSLLTDCQTMTSGVSTSSLRIPIGPSSGPGVAPPVDVMFYQNSSCTGAPASTYSLHSGLKEYYNVATSSSIYVLSSYGSSVSQLKILKTF